MLLCGIVWISSSLVADSVKVFIVHSRAATTASSIEVETGIQAAFNVVDQPLTVLSDWIYYGVDEHMPSRGIVEEVLLAEIEEFKPDYIVVNAMRACEKFLTFDSENFAKYTIVFCAISNVPEGLNLKYPNAYFVLDNFPLEENIELILKLHPKTNRILFTGTSSKNENAYRFKQVYNLERKYADRVKFVTYFDLPVERLMDKIVSSKDDDVILELKDLVNSEGNFVNVNSFFPALKKRRNIPVYSFWKAAREYQVVGGKFFDDFSKGQRAGEVILRHFHGEDQPLKLIKDTSQYMFYWDQLKEFNVDQSLLPEDSIIYGKPLDFTRRQYFVAMGFFIFLIIEGLIIFWLLISIKRRKIAESESLIYAKSLAEKNSELTLLYQKKSEYLSVVAHDLKNPIAAISGVSDLIDNIESEISDRARSEIQYLTNLISTSCKELLLRIQQLLESERLASTADTLDLVNFNATQALYDVININQVSAGRKQIKIVVTPLKPEISVYSDVSKVKEMADNLISNAIKYSPIGLNVYVDWYMDKDDSAFWILEIRDEGPGFSDEDKSKMFKHFQRLSAIPTANETSSGLGLYITHKIITLLGGTIQLESKHRSGACFIVRLPLKTAIVNT
jgi:signal transduction histidine kinase